MSTGNSSIKRVGGENHHRKFFNLYSHELGALIATLCTVELHSGLFCTFQRFSILGAGGSRAMVWAEIHMRTLLTIT